MKLKNNGKINKVSDIKEKFIDYDDMLNYFGERLFSAFEMTKNLFDKYGFDDYFFEDVMGKIKAEYLANEDFDVVEREKTYDCNLIKRICLMFDLYFMNNHYSLIDVRFSLRKRIETDDVNRMSELFNDILDIREFFNIYIILLENILIK